MQNEPTFKGNESSCICEKPKGRHKKHCDAYRLSEFLLKASLPMQNNTPQLPAELEKRFDEQFAHLSVLIDQALSYTYVDSKNMGELKIKDIKHFLATALEEQKHQIFTIIDKYNPVLLQQVAKDLAILNRKKGE